MGKEFIIGTRFNDVLTSEVITSWEGENVILNGATGSGKTYFVENNLHDYVNKNFKSMLYLCNRSELREQMEFDKAKLDLHSMDIMSYQILQDKLINGESIQPYDYIICDEWHYCTEDSFNLYTDLTYDWVIKNKATTKIFMSGTAENIFDKMKEEGIVKEEFEYIIPYSYSYADIKFYKDTRNVQGACGIIKDILENTNDKIIYFTDTIKEGIQVYKQFKKYATFRCSKYTNDEEAQKLNDLDCIKYYNDNLKTFKKRLLVTTKCLDNGVNIIDSQVKHIICEVFELESAQQCLGRKRIVDENDTCTFYIKNFNKRTIRDKKGQLHMKLNPLHLFVTNRDEYYKSKYGNNRKLTKQYIYDNKGKTDYNKLGYWKLLMDDVDITNIENFGFIETFLDKVGTTFNSIENLEQIEEFELQDELEMYLKENIGRRYYKEDKQELIDMINLVDSRGRQQKSIKHLNVYLQENFKMYVESNRDKRIKLDDGTPNPNKDKSYIVLKEGKIY